MDMEDPKSATTPVGIKGGHASIQQILQWCAIEFLHLLHKPM